MNPFFASAYARPLSIVLAASIIILSTLAGPAEAMFLPSAPQAAAPAFDRQADAAVIQRTLELRTVQQRLMDYGLTAEETAARIDQLPDDQLHQLAANLNSVQAGGDIISLMAGLAIIGGLVVLIIFLLEGRIEIQHR